MADLLSLANANLQNFTKEFLNKLELLDLSNLDMVSGYGSDSIWHCCLENEQIKANEGITTGSIINGLGGSFLRYKIPKELSDNSDITKYMDILEIPIVFDKKNFEKCLTKSKDNEKLLLIRMDCGPITHCVLVMFYKGKATIIDSSNFLNVESRHNDYQMILGQEISKNIEYVNTQLQKMSQGNATEQQQQYNNPRQYNFILGNCYFISVIFMKVLANKIKEISELCKNEKMSKLVDEFYKYNSNLVDKKDKIKFNNNNLTNLEFLKNNIINTYVKSRFFEINVNKEINSMFKDYLSKKPEKEISGQENIKISDDRYFIYTIKIDYKQDKKKVIKFFENEQDLDKEIKKITQEQKQKQITFKTEEINTYITNINDNSLKQIEYSYDILLEQEKNKNNSNNIITTKPRDLSIVINNNNIFTKNNNNKLMNAHEKYIISNNNKQIENKYVLPNDKTIKKIKIIKNINELYNDIKNIEENKKINKYK